MATTKKHLKTRCLSPPYAYIGERRPDNLEGNIIPLPTFATLPANGRFNIVEKTEIAGSKDINITLRHYFNFDLTK
ncbi:MAG: hypothetical protein PHQ25_08140 [Acidobacteriota bacterium]|nr:hypothetical protein [Acidobacteriota bacterium]MDW3229802.1 hypothetical protein [Acidobacteriota bacterium]